MMQAETILKDFQNIGVNISDENGKLKIDAPKGTLSPESRELIRAYKSEILGKLFQDRINAFISRGIYFELLPDKFRLTGAVHLATKEDINFLTINAIQVLCHLRQMQFTKDIFDQDSRLLEAFKVEIAEREAVAAEGGAVTAAIHEAAVIEVVEKWFSEFYFGGAKAYTKQN